MISSTNNNNVNFTARLDLSNVKKNKRMWNEVAQMFETKTNKTPYTFRIDDSDSVIDIYATNHTRLNDIEHCCTFSKEGTEKFMALTPEKKVNKLAKLLNIFKRHDKTTNTTLECLEKLEKQDKYGTLMSSERGELSFFDRIFGAANDKAKTDRAIAVSKDQIFKDAEFLD